MPNLDIHLLKPALPPLPKQPPDVSLKSHCKCSSDEWQLLLLLGIKQSKTNKQNKKPTHNISKALRGNGGGGGLVPDVMGWYEASTPPSPSRRESQILCCFPFSWFSSLKGREHQGCGLISCNSAAPPKMSLN